MNIFNEHLKNMRIAHNLTHKDLSRYCTIFNKIAVSQATISYWENGKRTPTIDMLKYMADIFAVNLDWLTGRTDEIYSEGVIKNLEPVTFPLKVNVCDIDVELPISIPENYQDYEQRKKLYSFEARANIIFLLYIISYEWERYVGDRIYEFADKDESEIKLRAYQIFHYFMINVANKEYLETCTKNLNSIFKTKQPIFIISN
jgi:transcriptional regulator with XRE-family HTH domain